MSGIRESLGVAGSAFWWLLTTFGEGQVLPEPVLVVGGVLKIWEMFPEWGRPSWKWGQGMGAVSVIWDRKNPKNSLVALKDQVW